MRKIDEIIIHCSATREGQHFTVEDIDRWHKARGFAKIGYHLVVYLDGSVHKGRELSEIGAHCTGRNGNSIGICYIGGLDKDGKPKDTRTEDQKVILLKELKSLCEQFPIKSIIGHRDASPDKNGNGIIDPYERIKECPCFDVIPEYCSYPLKEIVVTPKEK